MGLKKYLWIQKGIGEIIFGDNHTIPFDCIFNPQKIELLREPPKDCTNLSYLAYIPDNVDLIETKGGVIMSYTSNIEKVRKMWFEQLIMHYSKHLSSMAQKKLITLSSEWDKKMNELELEMLQHRKDFPEVWI